MMGQEASVELLRRMLEIYSPSGEEEELASFIKETMVKLGFEPVWMDKAGNVYGAVGTGSPVILLCGHMDTVPGKTPVKMGDGRLYGRGAVDAKSSLAAMISAAHGLPTPDAKAVEIAKELEKLKKGEE